MATADSPTSPDRRALIAPASVSAPLGVIMTTTVIWISISPVLARTCCIGTTVTEPSLKSPNPRESGTIVSAPAAPGRITTTTVGSTFTSATTCSLSIAVKIGRDPRANTDQRSPTQSIRHRIHRRATASFETTVTARSPTWLTSPVWPTLLVDHSGQPGSILTTMGSSIFMSPMIFPRTVCTTTWAMGRLLTSAPAPSPPIIAERWDWPSATMRTTAISICSSPTGSRRRMPCSRTWPRRVGPMRTATRDSPLWILPTPSG